MRPELSFVIPGYRSDLWFELYRQIKEACNGVSFEIIYAGPSHLPTEFERVFEVKYIKTYGSPSRAFQMGASLADGKYIGVFSDDIRFHPVALPSVPQHSIQMALELLQSFNNPKGVVILRYIEGWNLGPNREQWFGPEYWHAGYHDDLKRWPRVDPNWIFGWPLMHYDYFKHLGGVDCRFEHLNMNLWDMLFRAQRDGAHVVLPEFITCDQSFEERKIEESPVLSAYWQNDRGLFGQMYSEPELGSLTIDFENWRQCPPVWERKWGKRS